MDLKQAPLVGRAGWLTLGASVLVGLTFGLMLFQSKAPAADAPAVALTPAAVVDIPAPDFTLQTVDGETIRLADLRGKVVALNFWATWCAPCRLEMPALQDQADAFPDRLAVLGVNFDENAEAVAAFRQEVDVDFPLLLDPGADVQRLYRVLGYPTTFFIDEQGTIRFQHVGLMSEEQLEEYLVRLGLTA
jgi:peroxiredoxin